MANLYLLDDLPPAGELQLTGDVAHHLLRVLRRRPGDVVLLGDGRGRTASATVTYTARDRLQLHVEASVTHPPLRPAVRVAFACPRPARTDWLLEHGTEIGIAAFEPLWAERSRPQPLRTDRLQKILRAAAGQCARPHLPRLAEPQPLTGLLAAPGDARLLLADPDGEAIDAVAADPAPGADTFLLLVGPEGGLTDEERAAARGAGFRPVRFAAPILRTETAALVGAAILLRHARDGAAR